jgi:PadR family transcriptional regulator, regulatory protein PadR
VTRTAAEATCGRVEPPLVHILGDSLFLRDPSFLILAALASQDLHGYGIMKQVEAESEGQVRLSLGTLYGVLDRLVKKGAIEVAREERTSGRLRRYYRLSESGADSLRKELDVRARLVETTRSRLEARRPATTRPLEAS